MNLQEAQQQAQNEFQSMLDDMVMSGLVYPYEAMGYIVSPEMVIEYRNLITSHTLITSDVKNGEGTWTIGPKDETALNKAVDEFLAKHHLKGGPQAV